MMMTQDVLKNTWTYPGSMFMRGKDSSEIGVWGELDATTFKLRGPSYLQDSVKQSSPPSAFSLVGVEILGSSNPLYGVAERLPSLAAFLAAHPDDFFVVVNRVVPGPPYRNVVTVAKRTLASGVDASFDKVFEEFVNGSPEIRDSKFKYVCRMEGAPWMVQVAVETVGGQRPVIMGKGYLNQHHFRGANYVEVDVDVSSSKIARGICSTVLSYSDKFFHNECFLIESQSEETLPERALFAISFQHVGIDIATTQLSEQDNDLFKPKQAAAGTQG